MRSSLHAVVANHRIAATVAPVALVAALLNGCVGVEDANPHPEQSFNSITSVVDEYNIAATEYTLPDGQSYPPPPFEDDRGLYEVGYGTMVVVNVWNCAWAREYLASNGVDDARASEALTQFAAIVDTDVFREHYDSQSLQPLYEQAIENARLGDPSGVQSIVDGGCRA